MSRKKRPSAIRRIVSFSWKILLLVCVLTFSQVLSLRFVNPPLTAGMLYEWARKDHPLKKYWLRDSWRSLKDISPHLRKAVLAGEDQRFLSHHGFDLTEMNKAIREMVFKKGRRGASTITMQVARTVFLWSERSWLRKGAEAYYTLLIEATWSKERILEIYLNTVDWGTGIRGAESASRKYFRVSSGRISSSQAAMLAAILPNPHMWSPTNPSAYVLKRQQRILRDMKKMDLLF